MFEHYKYIRQLKLLLNRKENLHSEYAKRIQNAKRDKDDIDTLINEARFETSMVEEEISIHVTNYLVRRALKRFVPVPNRNEETMWKKCCYMSAQQVLTSAGISKLRTSIRAETKERVESVALILAAITGVVGAITGMIAILN